MEDNNRFTKPSVKRRKTHDLNRNVRDLSFLGPKIKLLPGDELHCVTDCLSNADFIIQAKIRKWTSEELEIGGYNNQYADRHVAGTNFIIPVHREVLIKNSEWFKTAIDKESNWLDKYPTYNRVD